MAIPRKLHQIWVNNDSPAERVLESSASWREHAPQFELQLWTRSRLEERFGTVDGEPSIRSNFYRVMLLGSDGGVYVDADTSAQPGVGEALAAAVDGNDLLAATVALSNAFDNTPMGCIADFPGWFELAQEPKELYRHWNRFLGNQTAFATLPGWAWNAAKLGPRVLVVHNRRTLSPGGVAIPGVRIVLDSPAKQEAWKRGLILQEAEDLQIVAMRKSGHHAILRWLIAQQPRTVHHFNNCTAVDGAFRYVDGIVHEGEKRVLRACNFEDHDLRQPLIGKRRVLVIRSPRNCFASRIKGMERFPQITDAERAAWLNRDLWKAHAREFLGDTNELGVCDRIVFDRWHLAEHENRSEVTRPGESMFNGVDFDGRGEHMQVLNRWQGMKDHPDMQPILADEELSDLWQRILKATL